MLNMKGTPMKTETRCASITSGTACRSNVARGYSVAPEDRLASILRIRPLT
jgi:hypothetical protein